LKLLSFRWKDRDRIGFVLDDDRIADLAEIAIALGRRPYPDMLTLIEAGDTGTHFLRDAQAFAADRPDKVGAIPTSEIVYHPPVRRPSKICGVALNNSASNERKISAPDHPLFFLKPASSLVGHNQPIEVYDYYGSVHPEPELAVVIGKTCRHVDAKAAFDVVYGYSIMNDMTGNFMRSQDMVHYYALYPSKDDPSKVERREQHLSYTARYKGSDTFGPFGPYLVTKDEVPDPHKLDVLCWHKDELIAEDSTAYYTHSVPEVIAYITRYHSLWPGDVISMGTAFRPGGAKRSLHTANITTFGGPVSVSITGLGKLVNPVRKINEVPARAAE
jgi:2-keto-4-pentenoate hydratase/2-oxohepta-3-ene-1,7-dioic acid hydratase in catechol pathway